MSAEVLAELIAEAGPLWHERHQAKLAARPRKRAVGAGAKHQLVFVDRLLATLVHLRHATTHDVLACWFRVDRSTITRAIGELRPLLAERGCTGGDAGRQAAAGGPEAKSSAWRTSQLDNPDVIECRGGGPDVWTQECHQCRAADLPW